MKILVDRELFKDLLHELDYEKRYGVENIRLVIKRILENNPEPELPLSNQRPIEFNPPCAEYCIPEVEKIMEREVSNHRAIIEILDMLIEYAPYKSGKRCLALKAKLVGEL
jgi:hypothetical protein